MKGYSSYRPEEAEALRLLDKTVEGIILQATILREMDKLWRTGSLEDEQKIENETCENIERG